MGTDGKITVEFEADKVTPGTVRYKELTQPGVRGTVGSIYVLKDKLPSPAPKKIRVTIESAD
jgi:hypothetical protein